RLPTPEGEKLFREPTATTSKRYREAVLRTAAGDVALPDLNIDTGARTRRGDYRLADRAYGALVRELEKDGFREVAPDLCQDILAFYAEPPGTPSPERRPTLRALDRLREACRR